MRTVILISCFLFFVAAGRTQSIQLNDLHFNRFSIKNGLPEGVVNGVLQDKEGYIWLTTQGGLVRYDGYSAKVYQFGIEDPLQAGIAIIYEDRDGELWAGSYFQGLYQYNRSADSFSRYEINGSFANGPGATQITFLHKDLNGNLWIFRHDFDNKNSYLNRFDTKKHQFEQFGFSEKGSHHIDASGFGNLCEDRKGRIWVATNNGIYEYAPAAGKFIAHLATPDSSSQKSFDMLLEDDSNPGTLWTSVWDIKSRKAAGVWQYKTDDNTKMVRVHIDGDTTSLANDTVFSIIKDSKGRIWVQNNTGLSVFESSTKHFSNYPFKEKKANPFQDAFWLIQEDNAGNFWCANDHNLSLFDIKTKLFTRFTSSTKDPDALPASGYLNLTFDRSGTIWIGTVPQGVFWTRNTRSRYNVYKNDPGQRHYFPGGRNASFAEDKDGTIWTSSEHGLYHWYPAADSFALVNVLKEREEPNSWHFSVTLVDSKGIVWSSPFGRGLFGYNPKTGELKHYTNNSKDSTSISDNYIATAFEDDKGVLWIGTFGNGLCRFNRENGSFKRYPFQFSDLSNNQKATDNHILNDGVIYTICEDKAGILWLGTNSSGANRFNRDSATFVPYRNQWLNTNVVTKIFEDSKGHIWIGTHASGLLMYDPATHLSKRFSEKEGLLYDGVLGINEDNSKHLWITSDRGISVLDLETYKIDHFNNANGLPEETENSVFFKTSQGRFLMQCNNGFIDFDPEKLKPDTTLPIMHIESVDIIKTQTKNAGQTDSVINCYGIDKVRLQYNENRIAFNYVGLQYQNSALNQYAYRLEGYDDAWIQAGTRRTVSYTNLSPGTYVFHLKGANSDGVWNPQEQTFTIIIAAPWWNTWWAYIFYALVLGGLIWAFVAYRSGKLRRENKVLEEKVAYRTGQLTQSIDDLKSTQAQLIQSEKMASLGELTAGIAHEIQNPLNFVNNFSEVSNELIDEMNLEIDRGNYGEVKPIALDIKQNLEKINHHGKRADSIVKGMLQHSRNTGGTKEPVDINALCEEWLRLSYHGLRAKDNSFNATIQTQFDPALSDPASMVFVVSQDIGRVLLNLFNNAFYAVNEKEKELRKHYIPEVLVSTKKSANQVLISVRDNGNGIPPNIVDKIFQPFFTTKPSGQGTGLGLSLSYDIIKAHGGELKVESKEGEYSAFIIELPLNG